MKTRLPIYVIATGRIVAITRVEPDDVAGQTRDWNGAAVTAFQGAGDDVTEEGHWITGGAVAARPVLPDLPALSLGVAVSVTGFPEGAAVTVTGEGAVFEDTIGADGALGLRIDEAGTWTIAVDPPFPTQPREWTRTVTA